VIDALFMEAPQQNAGTQEIFVGLQACRLSSYHPSSYRQRGEIRSQDHCDTENVSEAHSRQQSSLRSRGDHRPEISRSLTEGSFRHFVPSSS
jgi:hypothetical protein